MMIVVGGLFGCGWEEEAVVGWVRVIDRGVKASEMNLDGGSLSMHAPISMSTKPSIHSPPPLLQRVRHCGKISVPPDHDPGGRLGHIGDSVGAADGNAYLLLFWGKGGGAGGLGGMMMVMGVFVCACGGCSLDAYCSHNQTRAFMYVYTPTGVGGGEGQGVVDPVAGDRHDAPLLLEGLCVLVRVCARVGNVGFEGGMKGLGLAMCMRAHYYVFFTCVAFYKLLLRSDYAYV